MAIFDLDETLIHCETKDPNKGDVTVEVNLPSRASAKVGINIRPYIKETLDQISKNYIMIIYTASHQSYADPVVNYLDPDNKYFRYRLYRHNCVKVQMEEEFVYVKDLRILKNINLRDAIIIDNSILSFAFHLDNGIPILPFYDNKNDNEFLSLINYLNFLSEVPDIRKENRKMFKLEFLKDKSSPMKALRDSSFKEDDESKEIRDCPFELVDMKKNSDSYSSSFIVLQNDNSVDNSMESCELSGVVNFEVMEKLNHILDDLQYGYKSLGDNKN